MSLDELYAKVTEAIEDAEALDDAGDTVAARRAYLEVSMIEEAIAAELDPRTTQGGIARCGAVRAALNADLPMRAAELALKFLAEPGLSAEDASELFRLLAQ
jgi:hypothetical protein